MWLDISNNRILLAQNIT